MNGVRFSVRFFSCLLVIMALALLILAFDDYHSEQVIKDLKERSNQIEELKNKIIHFNEVLTMSARMAVVTGDLKWEKRYESFKPSMLAAIKEASQLSPEIYRKETDRMGKMRLLDMEQQAFVLMKEGRNKEAAELLLGEQYEIQQRHYIHIIEGLNGILKRQLESALLVENSRERFAQVLFITVLILLLLSWLAIIRITHRFQEALIESNRRLSQRTKELDELTSTLDQKVKERTKTLSDLLDELQETNHELQNAQTQLLQSEKFSAVGQLAAGIAHEINNPIGFINSNLQTLAKYLMHYTKLLGILNKLEKYLKDKDHERVAEIVLSWEKIRQETNFEFIDADIGNLIRESTEGAEKIRRIIYDLRAFASPDKGEMVALNLKTIMESVINITWNEIKYKAELRREYHPVPHVVGNPQKITQVLVNLLVNAAQAIKGKGIITVKIYTQDEFVCFDISDTGCGISPENVTKIFDPFYTTKPVGEGVGLGLSISYDIIRKHGGNISFVSKLNEGTTFTVTLPVYDGAEVSSKKEMV
jgi:signal transduction histidine kinase